jgi:urease gamma subunit
MLVTFESVTWQQAQIFGRWLAFLEMRGIMQGIAQERLEGLARSLMLHLPGEPITLPDEVEYREEYEAEARARQWQRINEGARQLVERTLSDEQREQLKQFAHGVQEAVIQAGEATSDLARRASRATQEVARQGTQRAEELVKQALSREQRQYMLQSTQRTVETVAEVAQEAARQGTQRAEELLYQTFNVEKRQHIMQSMQETVESVKQSVGQKVEQVFAQGASPLPPELRARSIRYKSMFRSATGQLNEGQ